ncbi:MAG: flagellar hook-associated protein FlgK [Acidobacteriia bacterium]|nr:flagellar hook-associated protein FlgK [Terriglobia bacterium]
MSSLFGSLGIARQALLAQQMGLDVTQNNIANVNTPGYARQRAEFVPGAAVLQYTYQNGSGVQLASIQSYRSRLLDHRVNDELQHQGEYDASSSALQQIEALFNESSGSGLQSTITGFFNSFSSLANAPEDATLRQQVLARGEQLGSRFRDLYAQVQAVQSQQDQAISATVAEINSVSANIARLNVEVEAARGALANENNLVDQRQQLVDRLAGLVDISYFENDSGSLTITTRQGALLVAGNQSNPWQAVTSPASSLLEIHAGGADITATIQSGKLGGQLKVRDTNLPSYLTALDDMAATIIGSVNQQHALGSDLNGNAGGDFFVPFVPVTPGSNLGAARAINVAIIDTDKIAAAGAGGGPGSNTNAQSLADIQNRLLLSGNSATVSQAYSNLIFQIGIDTQNSVDGLATQDHLVAQLQNQRDAASGVSLDEEAINLMRYQKAFEASARFISLIDTLTEDVINILGA